METDELAEGAIEGAIEGITDFAIGPFGLARRVVKFITEEDKPRRSPRATVQRRPSYDYNKF